MTVNLDAFIQQAVHDGDDPEILSILEKVCRLTDMGFAALARVTETRWVACQVIDKVENGIKPGDELELKTTICDEIRECGRAIVIDDVSDDPDWRTHPTPQMYGFESYAAFPVFLDDRSFYGTLCAVDAAPRRVSTLEAVVALENHARRLGDILSARRWSELRSRTGRAR